MYFFRHQRGKFQAPGRPAEGQWTMVQFNFGKQGTLETNLFSNV